MASWWRPSRWFNSSKSQDADQVMTRGQDDKTEWLPLAPVLKGRNQIKCPTDMVLISMDNCPVEVHKVLMFCISPYFVAMYRYRQRSDKRVTSFDMLGIDHATLRTIVDFAYTGRPKVTRDNVGQLRLAGDYYNIEGIVRACDQFLVKSADKEQLGLLSQAFKDFKLDVDV
ncbi:Kelch-like protein 28 [Halotydeus destructor]|nr:Kelch-like protein 28 [Halotydeus destructor]